MISFVFSSWIINALGNIIQGVAYTNDSRKLKLVPYYEEWHIVFCSDLNVKDKLSLDDFFLIINLF